MHEPLQGKPVSASAINDQTAIVFPDDLNALGTLFGGHMIDMCDRVAAVVARRHAGHTCVTLAIDSVRFLAPVRHGDVLIFKAAVNRVWHSSMEIGIKVFVEDLKHSDHVHVLSAYFTFVAVDEQMKPIPICPAIPQSTAERRRYEQADHRRTLRLRHKAL